MTRLRRAARPPTCTLLGRSSSRLLTGPPPVQGGALPVQTLEQVRTQEPVAPGQPPRWNRPWRDLETICLKCLEKEQARRYESAEALTEDLGRFLAGKPIAARPIGSVEKLRRWARRQPAVASLVAIKVSRLLPSCGSRCVSHGIVDGEHGFRVVVEEGRGRGETARANELSYIRHDRSCEPGRLRKHDRPG